ncbi:MAG: hypothetical protein P1V81_15485 [Planctomycetota bacterium]|nr:hypothetical protein [Planctomycetota bacterium]
MTRKHPNPVLVLLAAAPFAACGNSVSPPGGAIVGLEGPGQVSVVTAEDESVVTPPGGLAPGASVFSPDSDYVTDSADVWVYDPSMESLETINSILSDTSSTAYGRMVNYGPYVAQVVPADDKGSAGGDDKGQSSGAAGEVFELFTVDSVRGTNNAPQTVSFWVPEGSDDDPGSTALIYAQMQISEEATPENPFGAADLPENIDTPFMFGSLATNDVAGSDIGFSFYSEYGDIDVAPAPGDSADKIQVNVTMSADQTTGVAKIFRQNRWNEPGGGGDSGIVTESWQVAFNETHFKRQADSGPITTLSREDFDTNVWRYNLYHATGADAGQAVDLNSGFGFELPGGEHGWIGYYGFWVPDGVTLTDGQTITEEVWDDDVTPESYTVLKAPGKLIRHTKNTMDLAEIGTTSFDFWDWTDGEQYLVTYHDALFWRTAVMNESTGAWDTLPSEVSIDMVALGGWLNMWSNKLGGSVTYLEGGTYITFYAEEFINPASEVFDDLVGDRLPLYGYIDCLEANLSASDVESGDIFMANSEDLGAPHVFRFDQGDMTLYYDAEGDDSNPQQVGLATGEVPTSGPNMWGMHSGPLVTDTAGLVNPWDMWDLDEFYTYETGHNEWNQYGAVLDGEGVPIVFDAPLQFLYDHVQANDRNDDATYDGESYYLNYGGPGDLWGIPSEGVDLDGDAQEDRWYPVFSIADGTLMGPTGTEYVVRGIEMEQTLSEDPGGAPSLDVSAADSLVLPTAADYTTPTMGAKPAITDPPAVVDGVVQVPLD